MAYSLSTKRNIGLAVALGGLIFSAIAKAQPQSLFAEARYGVVKIRTNWGEAAEEYGTGFIIDSTATSLAVLTNRHVVAKKDAGGGWEQARQIGMIPFGQLEPMAINDVRFFEDGDDLAILLIERNRLPKFRRPFCTSKRLQFDGMKIYALTYPAGEAQPRTVPGVIESRDEPFYNIAFDVTARPVEGGESGSPVLNERGIVVGMVTEKFAGEKGNTNRVLHSLQIRSFLARVQLDPCSGENQILGLTTIDFEPEKKQRKWSNQFIENLESCIAQCPEIRIKSDRQLDAQLYWFGQSRPGKSLNIDDLYKLPSYIVRGSGRKEGKRFVLNISLRLLPGEQIVSSKRLEASDLRNLADSAAVHLAHYFGYETKFVGVPYKWRKWTLRTTLAGILPAVLMWPVATNSKQDYESALKDAESSYDRMHRNEILRNSATIITGACLGFWTNAAFINPRKPVFEKVEVK